MQCHSCEAELPANRRECPACGAPVQLASGADPAGANCAALRDEGPPAIALPYQPPPVNPASRLGLPRGLEPEPPSEQAVYKASVPAVLAVIAAVIVLLALAWLSTGTPPP